MTKDEVAQIVHGMPEGMHIDDYLVELVNRAVAVEREACAKVCEQLGMATNGMNERNYECAEAIRARDER
jgi:hypothetical protein